MTSTSTKSILIQQVLDRLNQGDDKAAKDLIEIAYEKLVIVTRKLLGSFDDVRVEEETAGVIGEVYERLRKALIDVKPTTVRAFMGLAAKKIRECLYDTVRRIKGRGDEPRPEKVPLGPQPGENSSAGLDIEDTAFSRSRPAIALDFLHAIGELPDEEREVVELLYFHGYTQPEASEIIGVHEDTVKRRWSRARIKLADHLKDFS